MKIAVPYRNGMIFPHFGHTREFKIFQTEDGRIRSAIIAESGDSGHSALAGLLNELKVDTLICGGIGDDAIRALQKNGIEVRPGCHGPADEAALALLAGTLESDPDFRCPSDPNEHDCGKCHCC